MFKVLFINILFAVSLRTGLSAIDSAAYSPSAVTQQAQQVRTAPDPNMRLVEAVNKSDDLTALQLLNSTAKIDPHAAVHDFLIPERFYQAFPNLSVRISRSRSLLYGLQALTPHPLLDDVYQAHSHFDYLLSDQNRHPNPPLLRAAQGNDVDRFVALLASGNVNADNADGQTSLMLAAAGNNIFISKVLIVQGADIEATDRYGYTALAYATYRRNYEAVKLLLMAGAKPIASQPLQASPLFLTIVSQDRQLASMFLHLPITITFLNQEKAIGKALLDAAVLYGSQYHVGHFLQFTVAQKSAKS